MVKRKRLIWQLYPSFVLLVLGALLATGWYASHATRSFYMAQTREDLLRQARLLTPQLKPYLKPLQAAPLDLFCKHIMRNVHTRMTVVLTNGRVVADSDADPRMLKNHADRPEIITALTGSVAT
ncbi:MAG: PAS domain-containing sensor histidine kinase, partial [Desulfatitalea sp.]|nr:PAS domain-containing sensor histidine kinase [Desulfatitalea sp.]